MGVDEGFRDQIALGIDHGLGIAGQAFRKSSNLAPGDADIVTILRLTAELTIFN